MARARKTVPTYELTPEQRAYIAKRDAIHALFSALPDSELLALGMAFYRAGIGLPECSPAAQVAWDAAGGDEGLMGEGRYFLAHALFNLYRRTRAPGTDRELALDAERVLGYVNQQPVTRGGA